MQKLVHPIRLAKSPDSKASYIAELFSPKTKESSCHLLLGLNWAYEKQALKKNCH